MICQICGKNFKSVGVHIRHKHGVSPDDYKAEFGIMKSAPLVDDDLSEHLSRMAKITYAGRDDDEKKEISERLAAIRLDGGWTMSEPAKVILRGRNQARNNEYLATTAEKVAPLLSESKVATDVRKNLGTSHRAIVSMARKGLVKYSAVDAEAVRLQRVASTVRVRREPLIDAVVAMYDQKMSLKEICARAGVGLTTYKRWRTAGLIPNRKTYMRKDSK